MVFQDSWDHEVEFISFSMITQKPIEVIAANGSGPLDDSWGAGVAGWKEIEFASSKSNPTAHQEERKAWACTISPLGCGFDPSKAPSLEELDREGKFEKFARLCRQGEGNEADDMNLAKA